MVRFKIWYLLSKFGTCGQKLKVQKLVLGVKSQVLVFKSWYKESKVKWYSSKVVIWGQKFCTMGQKLVLKVKSQVLWFKSWYLGSKVKYYCSKVSTRGQK